MGGWEKQEEGEEAYSHSLANLLYIMQQRNMQQHEVK